MFVLMIYYIIAKDIF